MVGAAVTIYFKSFTCGVASFLTGVLIDVDHILDHFLNYGFRFRIKTFYYCCTRNKYGRLSLILHSYELVILLWALIFTLRLGSIWTAAAIGMTQHLILDHIRNIARGKVGWQPYFFLFRLKNRFMTDRIMKKR